MAEDGQKNETQLDELGGPKYSYVSDEQIIRITVPIGMFNPIKVGLRNELEEKGFLEILSNRWGGGKPTIVLYQ